MTLPGSLQHELLQLLTRNGQLDGIARVLGLLGRCDSANGSDSVILAFLLARAGSKASLDISEDLGVASQKEPEFLESVSTLR